MFLFLVFTYVGLRYFLSVYIYYLLCMNTRVHCSIACTNKYYENKHNDLYIPNSIQLQRSENNWRVQKKVTSLFIYLKHRMKKET